MRSCTHLILSECYLPADILVTQHILRSTWPSLIVKVLATREKFLGQSCYSTEIKCLRNCFWWHHWNNKNFWSKFSYINVYCMFTIQLITSQEEWKSPSILHFLICWFFRVFLQSPNEWGNFQTYLQLGSYLNRDYSSLSEGTRK